MYLLQSVAPLLVGCSQQEGQTHMSCLVLQNNQQSLWSITLMVKHILHELHRLNIPEQIQYNLYVLVYCCLHGTAPSYITGSLC